MGEKYKGIDPKEFVCLTYMARSGRVYVITTTKDRSKYFLYKIENNTATKTSKTAETPTELEKYIEKEERKTQTIV